MLLSFVNVQWTGAGVTLETGASAVQHVAVALRREGEPVPIPLRQMVVLVVLETTWRLKAVTLILAQVIFLGARLSSIIIHQIFSLARDWSKRVTCANIPQLKLGHIRGYSPIFKTARVAKKI